MSKIPSPCIGVCRLEPASGLCAGCLRTGEGIAAWLSAGDAERLAILERVRARREAARPADPDLNEVRAGRAVR